MATTLRSTKQLTAAGAVPETMPRIRLGRTGLEISVQGWGMPGGGHAPEAAEAIWQAYARRGGNFLDTASSYGLSEDVIGQYLSRYRKDYILATKTHPVDADQTLRDLERSLTRMKTDAIDLFYAPHGCWEEERLANCLKKGGVVEGGLKAKERGLVRHLAFSFDYFQGLDIRRLRELIDTGIFEAVQLPYGIVAVEPVDQEIIPQARERGMGIIANFPTLSGLTGKEWGVFHADFEGVVDTPGQATLLAVLCHPHIDCVLSRFSSVPRVEENCFVGRRLAAMTKAERRAVRRRIDAHGPVRWLQRDECPPAPADLRLRYHLIYLDLFTRFGFGGARPAVEQLIRRTEEMRDHPWEPQTRQILDETRRACPVLLTPTK